MNDPRTKTLPSPVITEIGPSDSPGIGPSDPPDVVSDEDLARGIVDAEREALASDAAMRVLDWDELPPDTRDQYILWAKAMKARFSITKLS